MTISIPSQLLPSFDRSHRGEMHKSDHYKHADAAASASDNRLTTTNVNRLQGKQSAEKTADTILKHVDRNIASMRRQGASEEQIANRVQAARDGIATGYAEARDFLKDAGLLTDDLAQDINKSEKWVSEGLDNIERGQPLTLLTPSASKTDTGSPSTFNRTSVSGNLSLDIMTRDGDRVSIRIASSFDSVTTNRSSAFEINNQWMIETEGQLDDDEKQAIGRLLSDVETLSNKFFSGDLGGALEQAMSLGFDGNELAAMSLNIQQQSFSNTVQSSGGGQGKIPQAYLPKAVELPTSELNKQRSYLADYVDAYMSALERARPLTNVEDTLSSLFDKLTEDVNGLNTLKSFNSGLNKALSENL
ncbi:MAG: DUF5610 domain-containing protein [Oleibacter sp.]|nr:DUF5610 domain-containing protein [Thalassolituus sp.]